MSIGNIETSGAPASDVSMFPMLIEVVLQSISPVTDDGWWTVVRSLT